MSQNICGDETCTSPGCDKEQIDLLLDAWHEQQQQTAREIVRSLLGLPL